MHAEPDERLERMLSAWSATAYVEGQLSGGYRNRVWAVRIGNRRYAARLSSRPEATLDWEIRLLDYLRGAGMHVPEVLRTRDGRSHVDGDLAALPLDLGPVVGQERLALAQRAAIAWEVANGWVSEPAYARRRLAELDSTPEP